MTSTDALLARAAERWPTRVALAHADARWTFHDFDRSVTRHASMLSRSGVRAGDRVGLLMPNRPEWLFVFHAVSRIGAVVVPINPAYTPVEVASILDAVGLRTLLVDERLSATVDIPRLRSRGTDVLVVGAADPTLETAQAGASPRAIVADSDPAVIYFSSGSTGHPKGVIHSHRSLRMIAESVRENWQIVPGDRLLVAMPLAFVYASVVECLTAIAAGATIVLDERLQPEDVLRRIAAGEITAIMGVPAMYRRLLDAADRPARGRLRLCATAGDLVPPALDRAFEQAFGCPLLDFYGLTEAPHIVAHTPGRDVRSRPLCCGRPLPGVSVKVVDEAGEEVAADTVGELLARAPWMFLGYFADPAATGEVLRDGWFSTGDLVRRDADGYVYMLERKKDLIKRSGFNVLPAEVEDAIRNVPGVVEVAVVGVPDEVHGERVRAVVVSIPGRGPTREMILAASRARLAKYKVPEEILFVDQLPKGPTGKIKKKLLREAPSSSGA